MKNNLKDSLLTRDTTLGRANNTSTYIISLPKYKKKDAQYWLFEGDSLGNKVQSFYLRNSDGNQHYGMDITYLPSGIYLFYIYYGDYKQEYIIQLK